MSRGPSALPALVALPAPLGAALVALAALAACAGGPRPGAGGPGPDDLGVRLVARGAEALGQTGGFRAGGDRLPADCSGFVTWVYETEGVPLRRLMAAAAPGERSGVAAAFQAARAYGVVFGGGGEWPRPGDLVFFKDTYDRNRNGAVDDPFTHLGIVERVEGGAVTFLHRGAQAVARGTLTLERAGEARDADGRVLNTALREKRPRLPDAPVLAGQLFMGYGRIELAGGAR